MVSNLSSLDKNIQDIISLNMGTMAGVQGSLISAAENKDLRSILVTSCHRQEGKTVTAVSMAYGLSSQSSAEVLLIDGNFTAPKIHEHFGVNIGPGFSDILSSNTSFEDAIRQTGDAGLTLLTQGTSVTSLLDLYRSHSFEEKLGFFKKNFDYVIYDGTSVFGASDASTIARHFDGIILVVECEGTRWEVVQEVKERIVKAGGNILGVVLNKRNFYIPRAFYSGS